MDDYSTKVKIQQEKVGDYAGPLDIAIDDKKLVTYFNKRVDQSIEFYKKKNLYERQKKNEDYLFGRQINLEALKPYNARYIDNVLYEAEATIKPIALSRLPDLYVTPGNTNGQIDQAIKDESKKITDFINSEVRRREHRRVLGIAHKHIPVGFVGAIKYRWNPAKGKYGNYEFYVVHYSRLTLDHNAKTNDPNEMEYIRELVDMSIKELIMKFPDKKDEIFKKIGLSAEDENNEAKMATRITISEVWFKWTDDSTEGHKALSGVMWKYDEIMLKKMKNPNWDWEGEEITFKYDEEGKGEQLSMEQLRQQAIASFMFGNPEAEQLGTEQVYHNYFEQPEFPYILLGYDQFGTMPYDETSRIEQNIYKQDNINKRGKQITEMADRSKGRNVFSAIAGLSQDEIEELDLDDWDNDFMVDGPVDEAHKFIPGELPSSALFQDQDINRQRVFQSMGTNSTTRGQKETDVATTAQILRESDFGRIDDLVEDTINYAAEKMARAILQMIKLRYTEAHFVNIMGGDGQMVYDRLHRDMIKDGMEVIVHASGVDKLMRKKEAYEKAGMKLIDPLTFYEATDEPNPKEKTERLLTFMNGAQDGFAAYMAKYVMGLDTTEKQVGALTGQDPNAPVDPNAPLQDPAVAAEQQAATGQPTGQETPPVDNSQQSQGEGQQEALMAIAQLQQGQTPATPVNPTPDYIDTITQFIQSPDFQQLPDEIKQLITQFAQVLVNHPAVQPTAAPTADQAQGVTATPQGAGIGGVMGSAMQSQLKNSFVNAGL